MAASDSRVIYVANGPAALVKYAYAAIKLGAITVCDNRYAPRRRCLICHEFDSPVSLNLIEDASEGLLHQLKNSKFA